MASPTPYSLAYDFTSFQAASPATPLPADKLEIEFNALETTTDEIITNLNLIQRSDGDLANGVVTYDALSTTVQALLGSSINPLGAWVTATAYEQLDLIEEAGSSYICAVDHTSGVFATDYAAGKWVIWAGSGGSVTVNNSNWSGTDLAVVNGGTGASDAATARTNLGVGTGDSPQFTALNVGDASDTTITRVSAGVIAVEGSNVVLASSIGVSVQAYDATLTALAGVLTAANKIPYATALNTASELDFLDEDAMTSNSATAVPSQQSVKAYVDATSAVSQATTTVAGKVELAISAEVVTGTDADRVPSVSVMGAHNGMAKFWADVSHSAATPTLSASYNVTSITDEGAGDLTITIATDFSSANWACVTTIEGAIPTAAAEPDSVIITARSAGSVRIGFFRDNAGTWTASDPQDGWHAVGFGAQ